jgi:hypothetical protein
MPVLNLPPGAVMVSNGMGMLGPPPTSRGADIRASLRSTLSATALLASFAEQLRQAGWTARPNAGGAEVAAQTFTLRAADGKEWFGALTAVAVPGSEVRDVRFAILPMAPAER